MRILTRRRIVGLREAGTYVILQGVENEHDQQDACWVCSIYLDRFAGFDTAPAMSGMPRLAIGGYDTVAYFTVGKAVPGSLESQTVWHDAR
jgi:hypothetical protein